MRIRNLLVLTITMALTVLCATAQERDGSVTYTDHTKQSITISRFGTVLSFTNRDGKLIVPGHTYRVCPCGDKSRCVDSDAPNDQTKATLAVGFPKERTRLRKRETLVVTATVQLGEMTLRRRLAWMAGSSVVELFETNSGLRTAVCAFDEGPRLAIGKMCPRPPKKTNAPPAFNCPPPRLQLFKQFVNPRNWQFTYRGYLDLARLLDAS